MMKLVATTVVMFLVMMSMRAHHGAEGRVVAVMNMNEQALLLGSSLPKGGGTPAPNPPTHIPSSSVNQKGCAGHNAAHSPSPPSPSAHSNTLLGSSLPKGGGTPAPNPPTHIPSSTVNQKGYARRNAAHSPSPPSPSAHSNTLLGSSLQKGGGTPAPDPPTHIPSSTVNQKGYGSHNAGLSPSPPSPSAHSNTMQLLFSMAAATIARK
ncbi:hypothetical protein FNV43_RR23278 [Rhamnella rubrinervis]|uniref:Uncharacterized protein n=1 Tax=Rhamnella rubrinervis TaxID=2594499 RepID=A0A8K0DWU1_9ROSA|nr:hypothetical protein FNV43_RR23278 [Rhamnella rubrinervis]